MSEPLRISSRQNDTIRRFRRLAAEGEFRRHEGEFIGAGRKLLAEAVSAGADITGVLSTAAVAGVPTQLVTPEVLEYVSPLKTGDAPVFSVAFSAENQTMPREARCVLVLENVQDPGNVGTVLRSADAFGLDAVILCGACADPYSFKAVRASMGAVFRQKVVQANITELPSLLQGLPLYGTALHRDSVDIRSLPAGPKAMAIGNEGHGLSEELLALCKGTVIIPMRPCAESLNAAVASAVVMWEMVREWQN